MAEVSEPAAIRVSLATPNDPSDIQSVVVEPVTEGDRRAGRLVGDGVLEATYRLERTSPHGLVIADEAEPSTRTSAVLARLDAPGPQGRGRALSGVERLEVLVDGWRFEVDVEPAERAALRAKARRGRADAGQDGPVEVRAIIPGVVVAVSVTTGDEVVAGQQLLVVEAMKMQNELRSPRDGVVARLAIGERQTIEVGDLLVVIE